MIQTEGYFFGDAGQALRLCNGSTANCGPGFAVVPTTINATSSGTVTVHYDYE
jgi:hypothetical protein